MTHRRLFFTAKFLALLIFFYAITALPFVNDHVTVPFTAFLTRVSVNVLGLFDGDVHAVGTTMASERFAMDVRNGCNAVETMMLFAAAVLSFPASARFRMIGLAIGLPIIQLVNIVRLTSLFWVGSRHARWFDVFHIALWQSVIILIGVAMFAIWSSRSAAQATAHRR
ncbi:MAG TPA: exosortase H [Thermoanaerobaculia bacterium]|jgi:exosortase H (IPTLxxWG-CTERM-specific)